MLMCALSADMLIAFIHTVEVLKRLWVSFVTLEWLQQHAFTDQNQTMLGPTGVVDPLVAGCPLLSWPSTSASKGFRRSMA